MHTNNQTSLTYKSLLCRNTVIKTLSIIVILSMLLMSIGTPARAAQVHDLKSVTSNNVKSSSYESCTISDGINRLTVDNSIGSGAGQGCLIDYSQFPVVRVRVENLHGFWTKIALFDNYNDVSVVPENVWARFGYIAPDAYAEYTLTFDSSYNSRVMFFVNAAQSEDTRPSAGLLNIVSKILGVLNIDLVGEQLGDLQYVLQAVEASQHLTLAADALTRFDLPKFLSEFNEALSDDWDLNIIVAIAARFGKTISISAIKAIFTVIKIVLTAKDTWETVWAIVTGSYAGAITFTSQVQAVSPPPPPTPIRPPLPIPTPQPTTDNASFVSDISIPDGTIVSPGQALTKIWRVKNSGTSTWTNYKLRFVDGEQMNGPTEITLPNSAPGETKDITINLTAPTSAGLHSGAWQIINASGTWVQGGKLWVIINVQAGNSNIALNTDPSSPSEASTVRIHAQVTPFSAFRSMRIKIDGSVIYELGAPEFYYNWNTSGYAPGDHSIIVEVADQTDTSWNNPQRQGIVYTLTGNALPVNHAPNRPTLVANPTYDWYVTIGGAPQLCSQSQGDPDGDVISQYRFVASGSPGTADSGWGSNSCYTFGSITPGTYEWHVQAKDSRGGISDWSDKWHFTVEPSGITATINSFSPGSASSAEEVKIYACTSGHAGINITMRVLVNEANDGSDSGRWNIIKEQGSPCFNDIDVPVWRTLGYGDGQHRVRVVAWAIQPDAGAVYDAIYTLNHRRPDSPSLKAPIPLSQNIREPIYSNSRNITFKWDPAIRATSYVLHVSTNPSPASDPNPVFRQTFNSSTFENTVVFSQDFSTLYWQVQAINDVSSNYSGDQLFGIDRQPPTCLVQSPAPPIYESVFRINWSGTDNLAGISLFTIQYRDSTRDTWEDWLGEVPAAKGYELFNGQPGHTYYFRCKALDKAGNAGIYPNTADTSVTVDPSSRPIPPWWNFSFTQRREITLLNNMPGLALPTGYPVHLHFDSSTTPTAADIYNASTSTPKCNDLRVVYNDTAELNRLVKNCSSSLIEIWFRTQAGIPSGGTNTSHQVYIGNPSASNPPADASQIWYPNKQSDTTNLYFFQEGSGSTTYDYSGNGRNCLINPTVSWATGKWGNGLHFSRANNGNTVSLTCGSPYPISALTAEFWWKPDVNNNNTDGRMAGQIGPSNQLSWLVSIESDRLKFERWCNGGSQQARGNINIRQQPYYSQWNYLAVTFDGGNQVKFYVNGILDNAVTLDNSCSATFNIPLEIGSVEGSGQGEYSIGAFRLSNTVKTDFYPGTFANIKNEPTSAVGTVILPPETGSPDLAITNLTAYPSIDGGLIVQVEVINQGNLDTQSGFYTDLYLNHLPSGSGDYTGSMRFWVNDPIPPGGTAVLTTVIADLASLGATSKVATIDSPVETSATFYAQTDSMGIVDETDKLNNIYSAGLPVCIAASDEFEPNGTYATAPIIVPGMSQIHNFNKLDDQDWIKFDAVAGRTYTISTSSLGVSNDTYLSLYDTDGVTLIASNDDYNGTLASQIEWQPENTGTYYILVNHWNPSVGGCGTQYIFMVEEIPMDTLPLFLPLILR